MTDSIIYKDTIFNQANIAPIHGEPTIKTIHKLRNDINANAKFLYSNLGGLSRGHLGLELADAQYALISPTPVVCLNHLGPLIILDGTTAHANSNMWITHAERARLFHEVTGV